MEPGVEDKENNMNKLEIFWLFHLNFLSVNIFPLVLLHNLCTDIDGPCHS